MTEEQYQESKIIVVTFRWYCLKDCDLGGSMCDILESYLHSSVTFNDDGTLDKKKTLSKFASLAYSDYDMGSSCTDIVVSYAEMSINADHTSYNGGFIDALSYNLDIHEHYSDEEYEEVEKIAKRVAKKGTLLTQEAKKAIAAKMEKSKIPFNVIHIKKFNDLYDEMIRVS